MTLKPPALRASDSLASYIRTLHPVLKKRVHAALQEIRLFPECGKLLRNDLAAFRSYRVGRFRIIYRIVSKREIEIVAVGPRRTIYEDASRMILKASRS